MGLGCNWWGSRALVVFERIVPGGWSAILGDAAAAGKLGWLDFSFDWSPPYTLWAGVVGGGFLAMASHGTDQLIVQRLLTCRDLTVSRKALVGSGVLVTPQFATILIVGIGLWAFYGGGIPDRGHDLRDVHHRGVPCWNYRTPDRGAVAAATAPRASAQNRAGGDLRKCGFGSGLVRSRLFHDPLGLVGEEEPFLD